MGDGRVVFPRAHGGNSDEHEPVCVVEIELIFVGGASIITARWSWKETKGGDGTIPTHPGMSWKDTW